VLVSVVVTRWSKDLFVIFITFGVLCTTMDDFNRSVVLFTKKVVTLINSVGELQM
jgi:hypothetical protein